MDGLDGKPCHLGTGNFVHENDCIWIQDMYSTIYTSSLPETKSEFTSSENQTSWKMIHFVFGSFWQERSGFFNFRECIIPEINEKLGFVWNK